MVLDRGGSVPRRSAALDTQEPYGRACSWPLGGTDYFRIAAPDTEMAVMEMKMGHRADMGGMVLLPQTWCVAMCCGLLTYTATTSSGRTAERCGADITQITEDSAGRRGLASPPQIAAKAEAR